uniref:Solute carrier family 19 member 1 n=1 Tax=Cyprinus carpio TaxID=7962 RepID=A0A8C1SBI6_CYPCA
MYKWLSVIFIYFKFFYRLPMKAVFSYSYMSILVPVFLLTDYLCYKPVLILQSLSHVSIWLLLFLGTSLLEMQFMEFFYGIAMAARVVYSSYIFSLVPATVFQRVASYSHSSVLMGVFTSSVLGQICVSLGGVSYRMLSAVSLGLVIFGLLLSFCLPWPKRSLFFNQAHLDEKRKEAELLSPQSELARIKPEEKDDSMAAQGSNHISSSWTNSVFIQMVKELKNVVKLYLICTSCGMNSTLPQRKYNGAVESASTLLGKMDYSVLFKMIGPSGGPLFYYFYVFFFMSLVRNSCYGLVREELKCRQDSQHKGFIDDKRGKQNPRGGKQ